MSDEEREDLVLGPGVSAEQLREAVAASGYPLQVLIQDRLATDYDLQPEWGFRDRFTGDMRAIDLYAHRRLFAREDVNRFVVRPTLDLIIECKRSSLPWLFFRDQRQRGLFPLVMGLHSGDIAIKTDDDRSTWSMPILTALGLSDHEFVTEVAGASTFAGCAWAGSGKIRLTGSEAYLGSVMPLRSALLQLEESLQPRSTYAYFQAALAIGLIVLDAPMIGVSVGAEGSPTLEKVTWQRLWRHEPEEELDGGYSLGVTSAIDIVHESFFTSYLDNHVMPFAREFASRVQRHHHEIATGKAFAGGMGADSWSTIESRLEPRSTPIDLESVPERQTVPRTLLDISRVVARKVGADLRLRIARRRARRGARPPR